MSTRSKYLRGHKEPDADDKGGPRDYDADDPGKRSKESVNYSKGNVSEHCGICTHFRPPHECELVAGHIVTSYWCRRFKRSKMHGRYVKSK